MEQGQALVCCCADTSPARSDRLPPLQEEGNSAGECSFLGKLKGSAARTKNTTYAGKERRENQEIKRQRIGKEMSESNKVGWLKPCSNRTFAASEGPTVLGMNWEQGPRP